MNILICLLLIFFASPVFALNQQEKEVKEANMLFKNQQWDEAIDRYLNALEHNKHVEIVQYDVGTAFYKKGNYDQSIQHLKKSLSKNNKNLNGRSNYNLGNAFYRKGLTQENNQKIDDAIASLQQATQYYDKTLANNPKDGDASHNKKIAEQELERLKKKKEEQSQRQNQSSQQNKKDDKKDDSKNQNKDQQKQNEPEQTSQQKDEAQQQQQSNEQNQAQNQESRQENAQKESDNQESLKEKQAQQILQDYEREAPQGLLNFVDRHSGERHVDRDW